MDERTVLVTGGSGFIGAHCIDQLLRAGYHVRTTVRSLERESRVRSMLKAAGAGHTERLSFASADLMSDAGWTEAVEGCTYVLHVASPFPSHLPKHEDELIVPAREGTLRVLRAARYAGVKRVVVTSSFAAVGYGHSPQTAPFDETAWTDLKSSEVNAYHKSKTLAERAAWDFIAREGSSLELSVVNPVGVFGPVLGPDYATSILFVERMLDGGMPACPRLSFGVVDVRDVADLHLRAMTHPAAKGERFVAVAGGAVLLLDVATILKQQLGTAAHRVPTREMPNWLVRLASLFISEMKLVVPELGQTRNATSAKARRLLGWKPRANAECIGATGESLLRLGLLKGQPTKKEEASTSHSMARRY